MELNYWQVEKLRERLVEEYRGQDLATVCPGQVVRTPAGECFALEHHQTLSLRLGDSGDVAARLRAELSLLSGVGTHQCAVLKSQGCEGLESLVTHPRFGDSARIYLDLIARRDVPALIALMVRRPGLSNAHPLVFSTSAFCRTEGIVFLDIETMGLSLEPIILIGLARVEGDQVAVRQYLARTLQEEAALVAALQAHLLSAAAIVSFNGRSFDVPYLRKRADRLRMPSDLAKPHFDVYHCAKRAWAGELSRYDLGSVEAHVLGLDRAADLPSAAVPDFYATYLQSGSVGPLVPILEHNGQDLISTVLLFNALHEKWC